MRRPRTAAAALTLALAGCGSQDWVLLAELPSDVAHVAVAVLEGARLVASTPLVSAQDSGPVHAELSTRAPAGARVHLLAFTAAQLEVLLPEDRRLVEETPLELAAAGRASLPPPRLHATGRADSSPLSLRVEAPPPFSLTASWLADCPALPARTAVDVSCALRPCTPTFTARQCEVELDLGTCLNQPGRLTGARDSAGGVSLRVEGEPLRRCEGVTRYDDDELRFECTRADGVSCPIVVHDAEAPEFELDVERVRMEPDPGAMPGYPFDSELETIRGLVVRGDRVYVHHRSEDLEECTGTPAGDRLSILDADTMEVRRSEAFPACVVGLAADPAGDGLLVLTREGAGGRLHRLSAALEPLASRVLPDHVGDRVLRPFSVATSASSGWLGVLLERRVEAGSGAVDGAVVLRLEPSQLVTTATATLEGVDPEALLHLGDGRVVFIDEGEDELHLLDDEDLRLLDRILLRTESSTTRRIISDQRWHAPSGRLFIAHVSTIDMGLVPVELSRSHTEQVRVMFEHRASPMGVGPWPLDPTKLLVAYIRPEQPSRGFLTLYDPREQRFRFGATPVGFGAARHFGEDASGRVWAALPWMGEVVRITPVRGPPRED